MLGSSVQEFAQIAFWVCAALLVYVYLGYPLLLMVVAAFHRRKQPAPDYTPPISILIAAYNEENSIAKKLRETLDLDYPGEKEILVLSDCSTDQTDTIVRNFGDPRVQLLRMEERRGKTFAQNVGVKHAKSDVLIFSDATTVYHPMALRYLVSNYRDTAVGAAGGRIEFFDARGDSPTGPGTITFWSYENMIKTLQSRIRTITGFSGCIYSVRKSAYTELADDIVSDLIQPLCVIKQGYRLIFEDRALAYEETTRSSKQEFSMRVRNITRSIRGLASFSELLNPFRFPWVSFQLLSHKIMRWMVALYLVFMFLSNLFLLHVPFFRGTFYVQLAFYGFAALSLVLPVQRWLRPLGLPLYFCTLNTAVLFSLMELIRGKKYVVWQTVRAAEPSDQGAALRGH